MMDTMKATPPPEKPPSRGSRPPSDSDRIGILRRTQLREVAETAMLYSPDSHKILSILSPDWGDIRKGDWERVAIAVLEAAKDLAARLAKSEEKLDKIAAFLEDDS